MVTRFRSAWGSGLTRTELLVALTMLVLVAAWIMPRILANSPAPVWRTQCLSNVKQLGLGLLMYRDDYDQRLPSTGIVAGSSWGPLVSLYATRRDLLQCPTDSTRLTMNGPDAIYSYGYNSNLALDARSSKPSLEAPERTVLLFEVRGAAGFRTKQARPTIESPTGNGTQPYPDAIPAEAAEGHAFYATGPMGGRSLAGGIPDGPRHEGSAVYGAADGHATRSVPGGVSCGSNAVDSHCAQGSARLQPPPCTRQLPSAAAGTVCNPYKLTFSCR